MFLDCINNSEKAKKEASKIKDMPLYAGDASLFEEVFISYIPFAEVSKEEGTSKRIKVNKTHEEYFRNLEYIYDRINWRDDLASDEVLADALMFYISSGLLVKENGEFYVDSTKLMEHTHSFQLYRDNQKGLK